MPRIIEYIYFNAIIYWHRLPRPVQIIGSLLGPLAFIIVWFRMFIKGYKLNKKGSIIIPLITILILPLGSNPGIGIIFLCVVVVYIAYYRMGAYHYMVEKIIMISGLFLIPFFMMIGVNFLHSIGVIDTLGYYFLPQ